MDAAHPAEVTTAHTDDWAVHVLGCRLCTPLEGPGCVEGAWCWVQAYISPSVVVTSFLRVMPEA